MSAFRPGVDDRYRPVADISGHDIIALEMEISMLVTLAKRYHRWLCETGAKTDVRRMTAGWPTAGLPWIVALVVVLAICWMTEKVTEQLLWFGPPYIRWVVGAASFVPFAGWMYATFTVFICSWRAEMRKDR